MQNEASTVPMHLSYLIILTAARVRFYKTNINHKFISCFPNENVNSRGQDPCKSSTGLGEYRYLNRSVSEERHKSCLKGRPWILTVSCVPFEAISPCKAFLCLSFATVRDRLC